MGNGKWASEWRKSVWKWETVRDENFGEISLPPPAIAVSITEKMEIGDGFRKEVKSLDLSSTKPENRRVREILIFGSVLREPDKIW